jgi:hypothetical protein
MRSLKQLDVKRFSFFIVLIVFHFFCFDKVSATSRVLYQNVLSSVNQFIEQIDEEHLMSFPSLNAVNDFHIAYKKINLIKDLGLNKTSDIELGSMSYSTKLQPIQTSNSQKKTTFFGKYKYWIIGGAAVILTGSAYLLLQDNPTKVLPIPPGRP